MNERKPAWQRDDGGVDFVQLIVGLMIISIAAVGTLQALYYGYEQLDYQMRHREAVSIARSYVEYWQGRVHTDIDFSNRQVRQGNLANPERFLLDERDPTTTFDDIYCSVAYGPIEGIDLPTTGEGIDHWKIRVVVRWNEPELHSGDNAGDPPREIFLDATMVPAAL